MIAVPGSSARITRAASQPLGAMSNRSPDGRRSPAPAGPNGPGPAVLRRCPLGRRTSNPERSSKLARPSRSSTSSSASTTRGARWSSDPSAISGDVATPRLSITNTSLRQGRLFCRSVRTCPLFSATRSLHSHEPASSLAGHSRLALPAVMKLYCASARRCPYGRRPDTLPASGNARTVAHAVQGRRGAGEHAPVPTGRNGEML